VAAPAPAPAAPVQSVAQSTYKKAIESALGKAKTAPAPKPVVPAAPVVVAAESPAGNESEERGFIGKYSEKLEF